MALETRAVMWIAAAILMVEIAGGWWVDSAALQGVPLSRRRLFDGLSQYR
jgi:hypothetical protein